MGTARKELEASLVALRSALTRAADGDLSVSLDPAVVAADVAPLARSLNRLLGLCREAIDEREQHDKTRYRALAEEGHAVVYVVDLQQGGTQLVMDAQMEQMLGYTRDEWRADLSLLERQLHPEDRDRVLTAKVHSFEHATPLDIDYRLRTRHGATLWVHDHATVERDADGTPLRIHGVALDITARRRIEEALKESELRFELMAKQLPHVLFRWGAKGLEYISPSSLQLFGRAPGEILAHPDPRDLMVHPDDRSRMDELAVNLMGGSIRFAVRVLRPNGDAVWTEQSLSPIFDRNGWIVAVEGVCIDITERMRMESAVRESEELFYTLAKLSPVGIFRTDAFGRYTYVNDHWRTITGLSLSQALQNRWQQGLHPADRERVRTAWQQAVRSGEPFRSEYRFQRPDEAVRWVLGQALPEIGSEGDFRGHVGTITDITDRKQAEQALVESERGKGEAARHAADTERRRLARELHDGALQDLGAVKLSLEVERKHERNERIDAAIERLTAVITELRTVVDNLQPGDLSRASLQEAIAAHAKWLSRPHDITLTLDLDPDVSVARAGTRDVYRIAQEALANAVHHGNASRITVRLAARSSAVVLEIEDDGIGFDASAPSHGMGLVNMRERAAALGGDLLVASAAGQGTRVRVTIPGAQGSGHRVQGTTREDRPEP